VPASATFKKKWEIALDLVETGFRPHKACWSCFPVNRDTRARVLVQFPSRPVAQQPTGTTLVKVRNTNLYIARLSDSSEYHLAEVGDSVVADLTLPDHVVFFEIFQIFVRGLGDPLDLFPVNPGVLAHELKDAQLVVGDRLDHGGSRRRRAFQLKSLSFVMN
jgi:hypothetical protein